MAHSLSFPPPVAPTIEVPTDPLETRTHALRYLAIALVIGSLAAGIFFVCPIAAFALWGLCGWFVWSASIVTLNHLAANSCLAVPIHRMHATTYDINCMFYTLPLLPMTLFKRCHQPTRTRSFENTATPILMLNGYLGYGTTLRPLGDALHQHPVYTMNIHTGKPIEDNAARVAVEINRICARHRCNKIILVGHSMGGLIAIYSATHAQGHPQIRVTKVITIGTPLDGTSVARAGLTPDARQMRPRARFLEELKVSQEANPHKTQFYHIASESDTVVPLPSALGVGASPRFKVRDKGHLGMIYDDRIAGQINEWLEEDPIHLSSEEPFEQNVDNSPPDFVECIERVARPGVARTLVF